MNLTILRPGPLTVLKDAGRPGHAHQGVGPSGAVDRAAYARANALVGNPPGVAVLECTLGGLRFTVDEPAVLALTGTDAVLTVDGDRAGAERAVPVPAGATVAVTVPRRGLRSYLAVRGGFVVPAVLGSRSTDPIAGIGPARPAAGDVLPVGPPPDGVAGPPPASPADAAPSPASRAGAGPSPASPTGAGPSPTPPARAEPSPTRPAGAEPSPASPADAGPSPAPSADAGPPSRPAADEVLDVDLGPRDDWFTPEAVATFFDAEYTVSPASNAVGLRLDGPALARARTLELPSEGVVRGSVQVPPDGKPIIFQADHPVTGGYPVIAVLTPEAADRAAQARPGARLRFRRAAG